MTRSIAMAALLALAAAVAWWQRDALSDALHALRGGRLPAGAPMVSSPAPTRKCTDAAGRITYTDAACPGGTREQPVGGQVSVLPSAAPPRPASAAASVQPLLRQLAPDADGPTLRQRLLDKTP